MSILKITFIQAALHWENIDANLGMLEDKIRLIEDETDLILLPEMFTTGFSMNAHKFAEPHNGKSLKWMRQMAAETGALMTGSLIIEENNKFYNRLYCVEPDGSFDYYDKRHLFRLGDEHVTFEPGSDRLIKKWKGWKICPMICYDLRFPVWTRNSYNTTRNSFDYDLLVYVANWPAPRTNVWNTLLQARAMENLCYTAGLNIIGKDGMGIEYHGNSQLVNFKGNVTLDLGEEATTGTVSIDKLKLDEFRHKFPVYLDADRFTLE